MDLEHINNVVCDAEENEWLSVSYANRYDKKPKKKRHVGKIAVIAVLSVAVLATFLYVDGGLDGKVFETAKATYLSVLDVFEKDVKTAKSISLPCNVTLENVEKGVATFSGGKAVLSFTEGTVCETGENSVSVAIDEQTKIVYSSVRECFVKVGDKVSANSLIGRYDGTLSASVYYNGTLVENVVGSENSLAWNV